MKESRHDIRPSESPEVRKRRLARERQRRHREKIRARLRQQNVNAATNHNVISTPQPSSQFQDSRKRHDDDPVVTSDRDTLQRKSFSQRDSYIEPPDLHSPLDVRERTSTLPSKNSSRTLKTSSTHPQKPANEASSTVLRRSERHFSNKPSLRTDKQDREHKRLSASGQPQASTPQKTHDRQQHLHQQRRHQPQQHPHHQPATLQQHQQSHQERRSHIRHRPSDTDHPAQVPLLEHQREHHAREQDREKSAHREQQQQPTRHEYTRHDVLHQQPQFTSNAHAYSTEMHQQHAQQSQHHHDPAFAFPQAEVAVSQQPYVTDPHRQYVQDASMQLGVSTRTYPRFGMQGRSPLSNAASGFATVQGAGQGLQNNLANASPGSVNVGVHSGLGLSRDAGITKYRQSGGNSVSAGQHAASQLIDGRDGASVDPYSHNRVEAPEERKRRLARERQRRRRKRLKQDAVTDPTKVDAGSVHRSQHEVARDALAGSGGVANTIEIPMHVRGPESNMQPQASGAMHAGIPNFESPNLASSNPLSGGVHALQVPGAQEDLGGPGPSRGGFGTHGLGVPGPSSATAAASGVLGHAGVGDLHRLHSHTEEKVSRAQYAEDPETRKRRLARDRQRRRRERLKSRKLGVTDPNNANVHELKNTGNAGAKLGEGVDARANSDSERRVVASEGLGEADRIPLGSGSTVFGTRADVAQSLTFGDQGRNMRGPSVADGTVSGMPMAIPTGGMMNVSNVQVNAVTLQLQNLVHWGQGFDSETSAKFAVDNAIAALQRQLPSNNPGARSYIIQQSIVTLLGNDDACRELLNGPSIPSIRPESVMRM